MSSDDYQSGRMGVPTTKTDMASVVDNIRGQMEAGFERDRLRADGYAGESHRHTFHTLIAMEG